MVGISRRNLLTGSAALVGARAIPLGLIATTFTANEAKAWVGAALAVAGMVAGMIAAHNRGGGGVRAMLTANFQLLNVAITKLDDIQLRLTDVYTELMRLPDEVDRILKQAETRMLHVDMLGVVKGYEQKLLQRDPALTFSEWQSDPNTKSEMMNLLFRMREARQKLNVQNLIDPATALVAATTGFVEANIMNVLGYRAHEIIATIDVVYLPWLDSITSVNKRNSAAAYTFDAGERLRALTEKALKNPVGASLGLKSGSRVLVACTGVNDYTPSVPINDVICPIPFQGQSFQRSDALQNEDDMHARVETLAFMRSCYAITVGHTAPRVGVQDRLALSATLYETEKIAEGEKTGLLQFSAPLESEVHAAAGSSGLPADDACEIVTADIPDPAARVGYMRAMGRRAQAETDYGEFMKLIEQINLERARAAFGAQALVACQASRDNLVALKEKYQ